MGEKGERVSPSFRSIYFFFLSFFYTRHAGLDETERAKRFKHSSLTDYVLCLIVRSFIRSFIDSLVRWFVRSLALFIHPFIHSFIIFLVFDFFVLFISVPSTKLWLQTWVHVCINWTNKFRWMLMLLLMIMKRWGRRRSAQVQLTTKPDTHRMCVQSKRSYDHWWGRPCASPGRIRRLMCWCERCLQLLGACVRVCVCVGYKRRVHARSAYKSAAQTVYPEAFSTCFVGQGFFFLFFSVLSFSLSLSLSLLSCSFPTCYRWQTGPPPPPSPSSLGRRCTAAAFSELFINWS